MLKEKTGKSFYNLSMGKNFLPMTPYLEAIIEKDW